MRRGKFIESIRSVLARKVSRNIDGHIAVDDVVVEVLKDAARLGQRSKVSAAVELD